MIRRNRQVELGEARVCEPTHPSIGLVCEGRLLRGALPPCGHVFAPVLQNKALGGFRVPLKLGRQGDWQGNGHNSYGFAHKTITTASLSFSPSTCFCMSVFVVKDVC